MTKHLCLLFVYLVSIHSYGQIKDISYALGGAYDLDGLTRISSFLGNEKEGYVHFAMKGKKRRITSFDGQSLTKTAEENVEADVSGNFSSELFTAFNNSGQYYWIYSDWDRSGDKELLLFDKIDVKTGKITASRQKMLETTKISTKWNKYRFAYDKAGKKLLVSYRLLEKSKTDRKNVDKLGFYVFDEHMNKLWSNEFIMPYNEAIMDNISYTVDNDGNAFLLAKVYNDESRRETEKKTGKPAYHFEIMKFTAGNSQPVIVPVTTEGFYIRQAILMENSLHEIVMTCTYSKKSKGTGCAGIFLASIDKNNQLVKYKKGLYEFPKSELVKYESKRVRRLIEDEDEGYEAPDMYVNRIIMENDGSMMIACEEYYTTSSTSRDGFTNVTYYYENIIASHIDATGKLEWVRKIPKKQVGHAGRANLSYNLTNDSTGYYFIYNDNPNNLHITEDQTPEKDSRKASQVIVSRITKHGVHSKVPLDMAGTPFALYPADLSRISDRQYIGEVYLEKSQYKPILITLH